MKHNVTINGRVVSVNDGTLLSDILDIEKPCGGRGSCGKCRAFVDGKEVLACSYTVYSDITVTLPTAGSTVAVAGIEIGAGDRGRLCYVLDIGTTTLVLALVSLDEKRAVRVITADNPQRKFGADVITRIDYCIKNSVAELHASLVGEINRMIEKAGAVADRLFATGNTTMLHTLFGIDISSIGIAPYTPAFLSSKAVSASSIGISGVREVFSLPSVSAFIGADIVSGLHLLGVPEAKKYNLLIDLGTNAEIVLYSPEGGLATAAAAGPCFEGANISCGMSARQGAICSFKLNEGRAEYKTIEDTEPVGICASGLIDIVSELLKNGIIDETGYMDDDYEIADGVRLSREDVRQYQLAKSAVYSAILSLMRSSGIDFSSIERVYISGGFSAALNLSSAKYSGLIPSELTDKATAIGNSSLAGAVKFACDGGRLDELCGRIKYTDLSSSAYFSELFIENMLFNAP
ncbi:MAG: DUF4445 domain-containing protein [Clostridia bacterium]|nr:DUF4445 domain-containing protein [Clostridia bacterium]